MNVESLRQLCLSLRHVTEKIQWADALLFCVGGKMFAVASLDAAARTRLSFKCSPDGYYELLEREGIIPAPYLARHQWVALERWDALSDRELEDWIAQSYELVKAKLPRSVREGLDKKASGIKSGAAGKRRNRRRRA